MPWLSEQKASNIPYTIQLHACMHKITPLIPYVVAQYGMNRAGSQDRNRQVDNVKLHFKL